MLPTYGEDSLYREKQQSDFGVGFRTGQGNTRTYII